MRYVSWGALYEGPSDALYLDVLLPRLLRDLIAADGASLAEVPDTPTVRLGAASREVKRVASELCEFKDALDLIFVHADTGGRGLEQQIATRSDAYCTAAKELCDWPSERCIVITPRHETEAWLLADSAAIAAALGFKGDPALIGLPADAKEAERLPDPKDVLNTAVITVAGRRRSQQLDTLFPAIAQRQRIDHLRRSRSFSAFENRLRACLRTLAYLV